MKKSFVVSLATILVCILVFAGCAQKATPSEVIQLRYHTHEPPVTLQAKAQEAWIKQVEDATGGSVKITPYFGQTLMKAPDAYTGTVSGRADISWGYVGFFPGQFPLTEVVTLPFMGITTAEMGGRIIQELYEETPEIQEEWSDVKVLLLHTTNSYWPATTKKAGPISKLEDFQGKKLRVPGGPPTEAIETLGAVPLLLPMVELYGSAEKGVIDGAPIVWQCIEGLRHHEVFHYLNPSANLFIGVYFMIMNLDKWNSLPENIQEAIMNVSGVKGAEFLGREALDKSEPAARAIVEEAKLGNEYLNTSKEELAKWAEIGGKPLWDKWVSDMEAKGLPGQKVFNAAQSKAKKYCK